MKRAMALIACTLICAMGTQTAQANNQARIKRINRYLANTPMRGIAPILEKEGKKYNISPYFIVAVSGKESSHGYTACSNNKFNVWGLGQCGRVWRVPSFENWTQAVNFFVRFIRGKAGISGGWPNATSVYSFDDYCTGCASEWESSVIHYMNKLGAGSNITY